MMTPIKERNIVLCVILSFITCGIYGIVWFVSMTDDMAKASGDNKLSGGMALVLTLVTCGIYGFFWAWNMGKANKLAKMRHNMYNSGNDEVVYLLLYIFGFSWIVYILVQLDLNKYSQIQMTSFNNPNNDGYQVSR